MNRRSFITLLGGAAAWPLVARAEQAERVRRIGVLTSSSMQDLATQARFAALQQGLQQLGWTDGHNLQIDYRWAAGDADNLNRYAGELVKLEPDVIVANGSAAVALLLQATRALPIVFTDVPDPIGAGFVDGMAKPGRNVTGFMLFEYGMSGKWLELLKQIAPDVTQVAVLRDPSMTAGVGQFAAIQAVAPLMRIELRPFDVRDPPEIERALVSFAAGSNGGLIVTSSPSAARHRDLIVRLAARHRVPAVYSFRYYVTDGGLMSYGPDPIDPLRRVRGLHRPHTQGRETRRPAGSGTDQIRTGDQPQDRQGARPRSAADAARPRRRGD